LKDILTSIFSILRIKLGNQSIPVMSLRVHSAAIAMRIVSPSNLLANNTALNCDSTRHQISSTCHYRCL